ncbi:YncE family protein [Actinomadura montaniterrae]|uniref:YncE family protein n=1 Tax=Actinomadura montaniterrae TaxID=1803903 RepID=A0A6L3VEK3_9ACTN|nr:YncE family protein [Actinomadura montaniterrae]KAB2363414.1 YncE family protein [Actinomadura montaniterrae]
MMGRGRAAGRRRGPLGAFALAVVMALLSGCESPVEFYRPGDGGPDEPVVGLGGAAPYVRPGPGRPRAADPPGPVPVAPAGGQVYAATGPGMIAPGARDMPARLYVADGRGIEVVDPRTLRLTGRFGAGTAASRVVPSWDMRRLWAVDAVHDVLVPVSAVSGRRGRPVPAADPAALYFTPDGRTALLAAGRPRRLEVRDPRTMRPRASVPLPCAAADGDFTLGGGSLVMTCTSAGTLLRVDVARRRVAGTVRLPAGARPGDVRLSPDGGTFLVADAAKGGVWAVDAQTFAPGGFVRTAPGARALAISRDARRLFVAGGGTLAAVEFRDRRVTARWRLPGGGDAVPGGVSSDGRALWLADPGGLVYAVSTRTGRVLRHARLRGRPAGLCVHPQPGRYSLGGTGLYR